MSERFYLDYGGEYGTIIRDSLNNDEDVYEYGIDKSEDMCDLLNNIYNEGKETAVDMPTITESIKDVFENYLISCTSFTEECIVRAIYTTIINNIIGTQQEDIGDKQLKQQLEDCEFANRTERACHRVAEEKLKKENDQLKRENKELNKLCGKYVIRIGRLEKENEDLKSAVDFYKDFQMDTRELSKENEELKNTIESFREKDKNAFKTAYDDFDFSYTIDKENLNQSEDAIHLKDTHTSLDFHNGILTMIVDPPECDDEIKIKLRAARLDFEYIR